MLPKAAQLPPRKLPVLVIPLACNEPPMIAFPVISADARACEPATTPAIVAALVFPWAEFAVAALCSNMTSTPVAVILAAFVAAAVDTTPKAVCVAYVEAAVVFILASIASTCVFV
jgi:hypothetical protein